MDGKDLKSSSRSQLTGEDELQYPDKNPRYFIPISDEFRAKIGHFVKSVGMKVFIFSLIFADILILIIESSTSNVNRAALENITIIILCLLLAECVLRILHLDFIGFFTDGWCVFDFVISVLSLILSIVFSDFGRYLVIARLARLTRVVVLIYRHQKGMKASIRRLVSQNRRRFNQEGFDIDITYITDRIVAMSVPAVKVEALYRNPVADVAKFFNSKHANHYQVYNLCPERKYPYDKFNGCVTEYFMGDHNPAPLKTLLAFCQDADAYLAKDPENIIAVHCKGGKGRTGTMICSYLMYSGMVKSADDAMEYFSLRRTAEGGEREGIEAKSQERYLHYFQTFALTRQLPKNQQICLKYIRVHGIKALCPDPSAMWFVVNQGLDVPIYDHKTETDRKSAVIVDVAKDFADYFPGREVLMAEDIRICFYQPKKKDLKKKEKDKSEETDGGGEEKEGKKKKTPKPDFAFWFHTSFLKNPFRLFKREIDGVRKAKHPEMFAANFSVDIVFEKRAGDLESGDA